MDTVKKRIYLSVSMLVFFIIIWQVIFNFIHLKVDECRQDLSWILAMKSQLSELILSEGQSVEQKDSYSEIKKRYEFFKKMPAFAFDSEQIVQRERIVDDLFFAISKSSELFTTVYQSLSDLNKSIKFIHEHHIAYMKNLRRRGLIEQDYDADLFERSDVKKAPELEIIRVAVSIQQALLSISNIFHKLSLFPHLSGIEKEFENRIHEFITLVNTYEDYSLDVQDGLLVEELLERGREFEKSFLALINIEKKKAILFNQLNENKNMLYQSISKSIHGLQQKSEYYDTWLGVWQIILLVTVILVMGAWVFFQGRGIDKTERILMKTRERYRELFENSPSIIFTHDLNGKLIESNLVFKKEFGYDKMDLVNLNIKNLVVPKYRSQFDGYLMEVIQKGRKEGYISMLTKSGQERIFEYNTKIIFSPNGNPLYIQGNAKDVTEQIHTKRALKESEEKLLRAKKMEALGLLAGGVAHDLNNILSGIVSYPEILLLNNHLPDSVRKGIETIKGSGDKAAYIVNDLLSIARGVANVKEILNLNDVINEFLDSPEYHKLIQYHSTVTIQKNLEKDLFPIKGSKVHMGKIVMNLVSNAVEALTEKGDKVIISTENRFLDRPLGGYDDIVKGEYALLIVSDNGPGIHEKHLDRIFEPFYTKKVMGRSGTGLGLAVVWNTVQDHNGYINVVSSKKGSIFELFFPITRQEMSEKTADVPIDRIKGRGEKILIVDDVQEQREIASVMLTTLGYHVTTVSSGEKAVKYLQNNAADLILLDMIMDPGMSGRETYERILKIHPQQKAIIASGFSETEEVQELQRLGAGPYMKKPYTLHKLGLLVKEELNR